MSDDVRITRLDRVLEIRLDRPEKRNALTEAMYAALADAIEDAEEDTAVGAILLLGSEGSFTAGNDIADFQQRPPRDDSAPVFRFMRSLVATNVPLVAAVDGVAVGIGATLLLHCDLVFASQRAKFRLPFVDLGLLPEAGSTYLLPRMLGHARAAELILLAEPFGAERALELGFVNHVKSSDELESAARDAARRIAEKPPVAVRRAKQLLRWDRPLVNERIEAELRLFAEQLVSDEAREALAAFLEKRKPDFSKLGGAVR